MPRRDHPAPDEGARQPRPASGERASLRETRHRPARVVLARGVPAPERALVAFAGPLLDARHGPAELVLDMGREIVGALAAQITVLRPAQMVVRYGEALCQVLDPPAGQPAAADEVLARDTGPWVLRSSGRRAFRYVRLRVTQGSLSLENIWASHWERVAARRGQFSSSDPLLNRIWTLCTDTLTVCTRETIEDAPARGPAASAPVLRLATLARQMAFGDVACDVAAAGAASAPAPHSGLATAAACWAYWEADRASDALAAVRAWWGGLLREGAVTAWEAFDPAHAEEYVQDPHLARCHAGSTGPAYLLPRYVLGVAPATPGLAAVHLRPQLGDLAWAQGLVPTPYGDVWVHWEAAPRLHGHVIVPAGLSAQVFWNVDDAAPALELGAGEHEIGL